MKLLLDTHALIWAICSPEKLPVEINSPISDINNVVMVSVASLWELQIKQSLNKITLPKNFSDELIACGYELLDINQSHIQKLESLPLIYRDPFDRIIIAQSLCENASLITKDSEIFKYKTQIIKF